MRSLIIRHLDECIESRLRMRAAHHGRSMEEEASEILKTALASEEIFHGNLAELTRKRFVPLGGMDLPELTREPLGEPPTFGK